MAKDIAEELSTATGVHHRRHAQHETVPKDETSNVSRRSKAAAATRQRKGKGGFEAEHGKLIKYGSLVLLIVQMVGLVLLMRYSRTASSGEDLYLSSTAVATMEFMKFIICLGVVGYQSGSLEGLVKQLQQHVLYSPGELLKLSVPSFLYMIQNNLLYLALSNLDAATYQVCYQLKILTTAVFSALLLNRRFSRTKWTAIVILTVGVAIVQSSGSGDSSHSNGRNDGGGDDDEALQTSASSGGSSQQRLVGLIAVLCAACTSGFSGVYFERILKGSSTTLWIRNIQMGLPSVILAFLGVYTKDHRAVSERGFFHGYTSLVWVVVIVQAAGGLIVAVVVRYADNVLKTFAASFSIIVSCVVSAMLFDFRPNAQFVGGTVLVVSATAMYSRPEGGLPKGRKRRRRQILPTTTSIAEARRSRHRSYIA